MKIVKKINIAIYIDDDKCLKGCHWLDGGECKYFQVRYLEYEYYSKSQSKIVYRCPACIKEFGREENDHKKQT